MLKPLYLAAILVLLTGCRTTSGQLDNLVTRAVVNIQKNPEDAPKFLCFSDKDAYRHILPFFEPKTLKSFSIGEWEEKEMSGYKEVSDYSFMSAELDMSIVSKSTDIDRVSVEVWDPNVLYKRVLAAHRYRKENPRNISVLNYYNAPKPKRKYISRRRKCVHFQIGRTTLG